MADAKHVPARYSNAVQAAGKFAAHVKVILFVAGGMGLDLNIGGCSEPEDVLEARGIERQNIEVIIGYLVVPR